MSENKDNLSGGNSPQAQELPGVKKIFLVLSGKGGVGKTTFSVNLAFSLSRRGYKVGLMDTDIHGPNTAKMLGIEGKQVFASRDKKILPYNYSSNLKVLSVSLLGLEPSKAVIWRGPIKISLIRQFIFDTNWGKLDYLIIDSPPGTGDEPLSVCQLVKVDAAVILSTPQEVALMDAERTLTFARQLKVSFVGVVENMSGLVCPHCQKHIDLFGKKGSVKNTAARMGVEFLGEIPFYPPVVSNSDRGIILFDEDNPFKDAFGKVVDNLLEI